MRQIGWMSVTAVALAFGASSGALAADAMAGKAKASACVTCHGGNGVSVAADIPNLAAQKPKYIESQLKAFRGKTRKNPLMNAIAAQLNDADIANLAAFFSGMRGAAPGAKSALAPALAATKVKFPAGYKSSYTLYTTINFPERRQVRYYYANPVAMKAAREGKPLPHGSAFLVEVYLAKLDAKKMPVKGADGNLVGEKLVAYTAMETRAGWGASIPAMLRNGDWNYAVFAGNKTLRKGVNHAVCFACHKPLDKDSYLFTLKALGDKARMK
jgi:cytochrome c553